jgi:protein TonB
MTHALFHSLNVSTLATWLSVAGFGTIGVVVPHWQPGPPPSSEAAETQFIDEIFTLGDEGSSESTGELADPLAAENTDFFPETLPALPAPPEMAALPELAPLPEIPALPDPPVRQNKPSIKPSAKPSSTARTSTARSNPSSTASRSTGARGSVGGSGVSSGSGGSASGMSDSARLAQGRMPSPSYPSEARRKGQTGTVVVEFIVDSSGRVISAHAKSPSAWPSLNNEAVRTVRSWKFPPGGVMKLQRPIVFQLR